MIKSGFIAVIIAGFFITGCVPKKTPSLVTSSREAVSPPTNSEGEVDMVQCEKELVSGEAGKIVQDTFTPAV